MFSMDCNTVELLVRTSMWAYRMYGDPAVDSCCRVMATMGLEVLERWMLVTKGILSRDLGIGSPYLIASAFGLI